MAGLYHVRTLIGGADVALYESGATTGGGGSVSTGKKQDQSKHPHVGAGSPKGGQFAKKGEGGYRVPGHPVRRPPRATNRRSTRSASLVLLKGRQPKLKRGGHNDPAHVRQLQGLINRLRLANLPVDGQFGPSTEAAVKAIQQRLGLRRATGIASASLVDKLKAAYQLSPCVQHVAAAAGHDVTPGHDQLHHWWTRGPGLPRWADSPKPWTTLVAQLIEEAHVAPEVAKRWASKWYIEVFHYAAGSDKARVAHGKPPRGKRVGPG